MTSDETRYLQGENAGKKGGEWHPAGARAPWVGVCACASLSGAAAAARVRCFVDLRNRRVAPVPARRQIDVDGYIREFPHMRREEIQGLENLYCSWDADGSGELSKEEMAHMLENVVRDLFDKIDLDGSGASMPPTLQILVNLYVTWRTLWLLYDCRVVKHEGDQEAGDAAGTDVDG